MFKGVDYGNMDPKGRVAIPARHREHLISGQNRTREDMKTLVVTVHHQERCLVMRSLSVWNELAQSIQALPNAARQVQSFQRKLLGYAQELEIDTNGRVLLSQALRAYANLEKRVAIAGLGERLEIWNGPDWDEQVADPGGGVPEVIAELRL
jgi:MraZ protein